MNLLVISPTPSSPNNQGNRQRISGVCKAFQDRGATIHFGYLPREWGGKYTPAEQAGMARQWDFVDTIVPSGQAVYRPSGQHHHIDEWWDEAIGRYIQYKCSGVSFDACVVNYAFFSKAFEFLPPNVIRILDTHDRLSDRREMLEQNGVAPDFFYTTADQERIALERADVILAITPEEAAHFRTLTSKPVITLGHLPAHEHRIAARPSVDCTVRFGFIGSNNSVNTKNISDFFQALARRSPYGIPCAEFHIYGSCCSKIVIPPECKNVYLHGPFDDVAKVYSEIDCVFIPFLFGTGQKIKLIEALSFYKPLICTTNASEGSASLSPSHNLMSHAAVIDAIRRFVGDPGFRSKLADESRSAFATYVSNVEEAASAVFGFASSRLLRVLIDPVAVSAAFREKTRAHIVDQICRATTVLDLIDTVGRVTNRQAATDALYAGAEHALADDGAPPLEGRPALAKMALGPTPVMFSDLSGAREFSSATAEIHVTLPDSASAPAGRNSSIFELYVDCEPASSRNSLGDTPIHVLRTPTPENRLRTFAAFRQIVVLTRDMGSKTFLEQLRLFEHEVRQRTETPFDVVCVDKEANCASWTGKVLHGAPVLEGLQQFIDRARSLPRRLPSVALAIGFSYTSASALQRLLLADCGPVIALIKGPAIPVDGEVIARTAREAAAWASRFLIAPRWATTVASSLRASVSAVEGFETQATKIRASMHTQINRRMRSTLADLMSREGCE